jgi:hypothetical protein
MFIVAALYDTSSTVAVQQKRGQNQNAPAFRPFPACAGAAREKGN